jgi:hypothetical protein
MEEQSNIEATFISNVKASFTSEAKDFITEICKLDGRLIPDLENTTEDGVTAIYGSLVSYVNKKLLESRNITISDEWLSGLSAIRSLPKSTKTILKSMLQ